jgi:two-component system chemotaxis response regulator CheB
VGPEARDRAGGAMERNERFTLAPAVMAPDEPSGGGAPLAGPKAVDPPGDPSPYSCPDCGGVLWTVAGAVEHYRCRVGHRFTREALDNEQELVIEDALWTALRALEEQASLMARVAHRARERRDPSMERRFEGRRDDALRRAERIRYALQRGVSDVGATNSSATTDT